MLVFLAVNGIVLSYTQKELYEVILSIASDDLGYEDLLHWVLDGRNWIVANHFGVRLAKTA